MADESKPIEGLETLKIGFIALRKLAKRCYRAGILVIDGKGKPLELRATDALRPDSVQVTVYGDSLIPVMAQDLCGRPLIASLREHPDVILADSEAFLPLHTQQQPVVCVRATERLEVDTGTRDEQAEELLQPPSAEFQPIVLQFQPGVLDEERQAIKNGLRSAFQAVNLVEPFERLTKALQMLEQEQPGKDR